VEHRERASRFEAAFLEAALAWKLDTGYVWRRLRPMVAQYTALGTAKRQVIKPGISPGFQKLKDAGRLDLTIEALVLRPEFAPLFTRSEKEAARRRLAAHGFGALR
jgi:hypothetical protein